MEDPTNRQPDPGEWSGEQPDIHPTIAMALRALDASGLPWVLLRGEDDLVRPRGDVDILVGEGQSQRMDALLAGVGFRRVLARGHGSHRFYFNYDAEEDLWLKLDIVSEISFGRFQQWHTPLAGGCLKRRIRNGLLWLPATTEQAWLQLLHTMLDKGGAVRPEQMETVRVAGALASTYDFIAAYVDRQVGPGTAAELLKLVRSGSFDDFRDPALRMASALTRNAPLRTRLTVLRNRVLRLLSPTFPSRFSRGLVVGVTGPEGAGRTTLLHRLWENFPIHSRYMSLGRQGPGRWDSWITRIPGGRRGLTLIRQLRGALAAKYHCLRGHKVVAHRPAYDIPMPGSAGTTAGSRTESATAFALGPDPDALLVLDAPGRISFPGNGGHLAEVFEIRRHAHLKKAKRHPRTWVPDVAQPQPLLQRAATGTVVGQLAGSAPGPAESAQPDSQAPEPGEQP
ncbi:hypothetical protein [Arthrobacter sp. PsM3]|uniref:hypothetical protein n=1 Tax=Arthrobacter sp. PsM3 TaxID=3030531 RepID=UPI00263A5CE5|nr:hypothetical protein [Arthrobacter sp. PsM3]MDN4643033.1 hypothetical protein [Arthrobacter sp. PsM3]